MEKVKKRLKEITPHYQLILDVLSPNTILSGGFLLQTMIGQKWKTDVDFFTTDYNLKSIGEDWEPISYPLGYDVVPGVIKVYSGKLGEVKIDIVHITNLDELFDGFDFDFCKIWCDGKDIYAINMDSVETKTCTINKESWQLRKPKERISKYRNRGFTINLK